MSSGDPLSALEDWAAPLLAKLQPAERRNLARKLAQELRRSQAKRIAAQQNPDGSRYAPRKRSAGKKKAGRVRDKLMFDKLRRAKHLRLGYDEAGAAVGFITRAARIARVHQYGLRDAVQAGGVMHHYAARELLGFASADREAIEGLLLRHLSV